MVTPSGGDSRTCFISLSAVVDELELHGIVLCLESRDDRLQVVSALGGYPDGLTLNLWAYFGEGVAYELAYLTGEVLRDALLQFDSLAHCPAAGGLNLTGLEDLERKVASNHFGFQ